MRSDDTISVKHHRANAHAYSCVEIGREVHMDSGSWKDRVFSFPAVLSNVEPDFDFGGKAPLTLQLTNSTGSWNAATWLSITDIGTDEMVRVGRATIVDVRGDSANEPLVLTHWRADDQRLVFDLIPNEFCPIAGVVSQVRELVCSIGSDALREFMASVFMIPSVFRHFWTAPASRTHHHAYVGGLAEHSLEVAVLADVARQVESWQRDLLVAYALLHDVGKVWAYEYGELTSEARRYGHEQLGYRRLRSCLDTLCAVDPNLGDLMTGLLSCAWKRDYRHQVATLGGIVRAMDRFSAARFMECASRRSACESDHHSFDDATWRVSAHP